MCGFLGSATFCVLAESQGTTSPVASGFSARFFFVRCTLQKSFCFPGGSADENQLELDHCEPFSIPANHCNEWSDRDRGVSGCDRARGSTVGASAPNVFSVIERRARNAQHESRRHDGFLTRC